MLTRLLFVVVLVLPALSQNLSDAVIAAVRQRLADGAKQSWELGTRAQAILELDVPQYSVLTPSQSIPPPSDLQSNTSTALQPVFSIAHSVVSALPTAPAQAGPQPLVANDGSAADPASIGVAVLLANLTGQGQNDGLDYANAAKGQLDYLMQKVPRTSDGAISHRNDQVQLWSDFVYMVPPFLAYYGVLSENRTLLLEGYNQIKLYRNYLRDPSAGGMWKHVLLGSSGNDDGHWATGNGWAASGMLRVLATIARSQYANSLKHQQEDLANWVMEIHNGIYPQLDSTNIFKNYPDRPLSTNSSSLNFYDSASTALLASTVYRLSLLWGTHKYLPIAERCRQALAATGATISDSISTTTTRSSSKESSSTRDSSSTASNSSTASDTSGVSSTSQSSSSATSTSPSTPSSTSSSVAGLQHFTSDGWLTPVVNPESYGQEGTESPESEAFVLEMQAAWQDWVAGGSKGANSARAMLSLGWWMVVAIVTATWFSLCF